MIIITESIMYDERNDSGESSCVINTRRIIEIIIAASWASTSASV